VAVCLDFVNIFSPMCEFSIRGRLCTQTLHLVDVKVRSFAKGVTWYIEVPSSHLL